MTRAFFVRALAAAVAATPALATGRKLAMALESAPTDVRAAGANATTLTVRHVGAQVSTLVEITPEKLARLKPLAETGDAATIRETLHAIERAAPAATERTSEQRWHLTFADAAGKTVLVVTSSIGTPHDGTIDGRPVLFANGDLARFLTERFAPRESGT